MKQYFINTAEIKIGIRATNKVEANFIAQYLRKRPDITSKGRRDCPGGLLNDAFFIEPLSFDPTK